MPSCAAALTTGGAGQRLGPGRWCGPTWGELYVDGVVLVHSHLCIGYGRAVGKGGLGWDLRVFQDDAWAALRWQQGHWASCFEAC